MKLVGNLVIFSSTVLLICASKAVNDSRNKTLNQDDSWLYYSMQIFNQTKEETMAPSETLLFHGYIPPVNHLEDYPQMVAKKNLSYLQTPTSLPPAKEPTDDESQPDSIQDLLEPAEADQSSTTEQDTDLSEEKDPDSDDKDDYQTELYNHNYDNDDDGNGDGASPGLEYQPPDVEPNFGTSFEKDNFEKRSDEDDEPDNDDYDQNDNQDADDEDGTLNTDNDNRSNRGDDPDEDEDGIEQEDFGDGGETRKIDEEIWIPHAFIWNEHPNRPEADDATGQNQYENDFDFDDTKFDKEYSQETRMAQPVILADQNDTFSGLQNNSTQTIL